MPCGISHDPGPPNLLLPLGLSMKNNRFSFPFPQALPSATVALGAALTLALLSGCSALPKFTEPQAEAATPTAETKLAQQSAPAPLPEPEPPKKTKLFEWTGKGRAVTRIVVDVDEQKARFYEGDKEVGWTMVASGVSKFPTPVGRFSVTEKVTNKESNLYGKIYGKGGQLISSNAKMGKTPIPAGARFDGADMPYYMRLTGDGIGMHAGPIPNPGRPASHGCIRMPKAFAPIAFRHVGVGTEVSIVGNGPSYATYLAQQRAQAARSVAATKPAAPKAQTEAGGTPSPAATAAVGTESAASAAAGATVVATAAVQGAAETATEAATPVAAESKVAAPAAATPVVAKPAAPTVTPAVAQAPVVVSQAPTASASATVAPQAAPATPATAPVAPPAAATVAPVPATPVEVAKVPAVAHTPAPPVAPAIATRVEPAQGAPAPVQAPANVVPVPAPAPAHIQAQIATKTEAPAMASKAEPPAASAPVFKPVPQVPEFRAPAPATAPALAPTPASAPAESAPKAAG